MLNSKLDAFFGITEKGSTVNREVYAGVITFLAMAYILAVNPMILSAAGMSRDATFTATAVASAIACIVMALYARFPVALAPGMGINAFFAFTVVLSVGYTWQEALAASFVAGLVFMLITFTGLRKKILDAIPEEMRAGIAAGIGGFIIFVGLQSSGVIVGNPSTLVMLGNILDPKFLLAMFGIIVTVILYIRKVKTTFIIGIVTTAAAGILAGIISAPTGIVSVPDFSYLGAFAQGFSSIDIDMKFVAVVFSFLFVCMFDTAGTLLTVGKRAGLIENGSVIGGNKAFAADSVGMVAGAILGTSPVTSYVESTAGIEAGGRTGLMALTVGLLFLVALIFGPLFTTITAQCTMAVLIIVGFLMMTELAHIDYKDPVAVITAMSILFAMIFTYSITNGIGIGFIIYSLMKIFTGKARNINPYVAAFTVLFVVYFLTTALL